MTKRILVCDDYPEIREGLARGLRIAGYDVVQAEDGQAALEAFKADPTICFILSDHDMPRMTGLQFCAAVRGSGSKVPFVLLTGNGLALIGAKTEGVTKTFMKPTRTQFLVEYIRDVLWTLAQDDTHD